MKSRIIGVVFGLCAASGLNAADGPSTPDTAPKSVIDTLMDGKAHVHIRYRFETVDDDLVPANDANASTIRAALGWETGVYKGFSAFAEMEHISEFFADDFREGPGPVDPGKAGVFPVVADPPGTELNQAYLRYAPSDLYTIKLGRQSITYRKAPLHRFIGNVLWRQNWQTQDAVSLEVKPAAGVVLNYAYSAQVNRIFGDDAPEPFDDFDCNCHMINAKYLNFAHLKLEAYAYLLDIDNAPAAATDTFGFRAHGAYPLTDSVKVLYAGEFASQDEAGPNPANVTADYYLGELGAAFKLPLPLMPGITIKFDYEVLEGNGTTAFQTPLATGHAFQGWADRFLTTPRDGIEDFYITAIAKLLGGKFLVSYHMLESDQLGYDYGDELNVLYARKFAKYWTFGAKAAFYDADRNPTALARAGGLQNNDVTKVWAWLQFVY